MISIFFWLFYRKGSWPQENLIGPWLYNIVNVFIYSIDLCHI